MKFNRVAGMVAGFWLLLACAGVAFLLHYEAQPGPVSPVETSLWPAASTVSHSRDGFTLLMFAHPKCPCTRASVENLNSLLARTGPQLETHVLFIQPANMPAEWVRSSTWHTAESIPGVHVVADLEGKEARLFGAETSGYVLLYDNQGKLVYRGGLTATRAHVGDSAGAGAILAALSGKRVERDSAPVFGCDLMDRCVASK